MANGTIAFDTLSTSGQITGTAKSVDTDYVVNGSAKSWWHCQMYTPSLSSSFNTSGLTDNGVGDFNIALTNALDSSIRSSGACLSGSSVNSRYISLGTGTNTASSVNFLCRNDGSAAQDEDSKGQLTGDLA